MFWLNLHLMTNHFPIILTLVGTAACILGAARRIRDAWIYGALCLALAGATSVPAWITGNESHLPFENELGVPEGTVEDHELFAEATMWIMIPMGALAAFAWWRAREEPRRGPSPTWMWPTVLAVSFLGSAMIGYTAYLGGRIGHNAKTIEALKPDSARARPRPPESK
jgi:drug/metabolite transporter (DMT)-like permease